MPDSFQVLRASLPANGIQCVLPWTNVCSVKAYHKLPVVMAIAKHAVIVRFQLSAVTDVKEQVVIATFLPTWTAVAPISAL